MPPDAPAHDEILIERGDDPVSKECSGFLAQMRSAPGQAIVRVVVTRSPQWGVVWRADMSISAPDDEPMLFRIVCSKENSLVRPLEMADPTQNIPPLDEGMRATHPN